MKIKITIFAFLLVFLSIESFGQARRNVRIGPCDDTLCYNSELYITVAGNSFFPTSYVWSNGSTSPTSNVTVSGTYTVTVTGFVGNSNQVAQVTTTKNIVVLDKPKIIPITSTWVCTYDTVKLGVDQSYTNYIWNNGSTDIVFSRQMNGANTGYPALDTVSVWYTASIGALCQVNSDTVVIRGIRRPNGVGAFYEGRTDLTVNDSVPAGLVLTYVYEPQYEMEFTKVSDPNYVVTYITPTTTRFAPLNILDSGNDYHVRTRPILNGVEYCWGDYSYIGILPNNPIQNESSLSRISDNNAIYEFYDMSGRFLFYYKGNETEKEWQKGFSNQLYIVVKISRGENNSERFLTTSLPSGF